MPLNAEIEYWLNHRSQRTVPSSMSELRSQVSQDIIEQQGIDCDSYYQSQFFVSASDQHQIAVRSYIPYALELQQQRPAIVFAHGGGWCLGNLDAWDRSCRLLAESTQHVVFSVDYRLAPEFKFPIPLRDYFSALRYVQHNALMLGIDTNKIVVGGDSAGANIAAAACILAKQYSEIKISHQLLFYPALDATMSSKSYEDYAESYDLTTAMMAYCWEQYLNDSTESTNELVSPLLAQSLSGLANATIFVAEYDPVRHDGERYAQKLMQDTGHNVKLHVLNGMIHGAIHMTSITSVAESIYSKIEL